MKKFICLGVLLIIISSCFASCGITSSEQEEYITKEYITKVHFIDADLGQYHQENTETKINNWLAANPDIEILDIKLERCATQYSTYSTIMIIYKEAKN